MKIPVKDIYFDKDIYPREKPSQSVINEYEESLTVGKIFPPIIVEKIIYFDDNGKETIRNTIIDGVHRYHGVEQYNTNSKKNDLKKIEEIEITYHDDITVRTDNKIGMADLIIASAKYNSQHGVRLKKSDMETDARKIYGLNPAFKQQELANILGVTQQAVSNWIADLVEANKASEDAIILKLHLLGWTQEEIGAAVGLTQGRIAQRLLEIQNFVKLIKPELEKANTPEKIVSVAKYRKIEQITALAIKFGDVDDESIMNHDLIGCSSRPYDVWNFSKCMPYCGSTYPGRIPGQLVLQTLYFYTKRGDFVVDPMGGSGTTVDACLLMGRKCKAFDSDKESKRAEDGRDIVICDAIEGLKSMKSKADLIFIDPPYYRKVDDGYSDASISRLDKDAYMKFFEEFAKAAKDSLKKGGKLAFLMSKYTEDNPKDSIFLHHYIRIFEAAGFEYLDDVQCPLGTEQIGGDFVNKLRENRKKARLSRLLMIFR